MTSCRALPPGPWLVMATTGRPQHDAAMPIDERMQLAEGQRSSKLFAAMAQQDCNQCATRGRPTGGYRGRKARPSSTCVRRPEQPHAEAAARGGAGRSGCACGRRARARGRASREASQRGYSARSASRGHLPLGHAPNAAGSEKDLRVMSCSTSPLRPQLCAGDSFGLYPAMITTSLMPCWRPCVRGGFPVWRQDLPPGADRGLCPQTAPDALLELIGYLAGGAKRKSQTAGRGQ